MTQKSTNCEPAAVPVVGAFTEKELEDKEYAYTSLHLKRPIIINKTTVHILPRHV
jgi:hypothetical protein